MYTGTLIQDLMAAVERAEELAGQTAEKKETYRQIEEELELQVILAMQIPVMEGEHIFVGAA